MEEIKDEIIVIENSNYKEKDKLITFYSLHGGLGSAKVRGVRGQNAKLKFLPNTFCYSEVVFFKNNDSLIVKTANINETFFNLAADLNKFAIASAILDVLKSSVYFGEPNALIFILTLKSLYEICFNEDINPDFVFCKYVIEILKLTGYNTNFENCNRCGKELIKGFVDLDTGELVCEHCKTGSALVVSKLILKYLSDISNTKIVKLSTLEIDDISAKQCKNILKKIFCCKAGKELKSF